MKGKRNYWLDVVMGLLALVLIVSSFLLWVVLPQGYFPSRLLWLAIHKWVGLALTVAALVHVAFHWRWLVRMTRWYWTRVRGERVRPRPERDVSGSSQRDLPI
jgi:hypothetical protein